MIARGAWRVVCALVWASAWGASAAALTPPNTNANLAGSYQLQGVREVGAELRLHPDGRFEFGMAYGGADLAAQGQWVSKGRLVVLTTDTPPAAGFKLNSSNANAPNDYDQHPDKPTLLVVEVKTPRLGLVWSNMAIVAEFSNGQTRSGTSGRNGMLGFLARAEPEWKDVYVQRISVAHPKEKVDATSYQVDSRRTRSIAIDFEPGHLAPPAFERATFSQPADAASAVLVQRSQEGPGKVGWTFIRR